MKKDHSIDYSYFYMQAKKALDEAHQAMLKKDHTHAIESGLYAIAETKLMVNAMKELKDALCK